MPARCHAFKSVEVVEHYNRGREDCYGHQDVCGQAGARGQETGGLWEDERQKKGFLENQYTPPALENDLV